MKAVVVRETGDPSVLSYEDVPTPEPKQGEVLVKAHSIGVNRPEIMVRKGTYRWLTRLPVIPGIEMSGTVAALGPGVSGLTVGQPVLVSARDLPERCGCYAEYIAVPEKAARPLPDGCDLEKAACLANYQVAYHCLFTAAAGKNAKSVLVSPASGGIGSAAMQLAKAHGLFTIALVSSPAKAAAIAPLNADAIIVRETEDPVERVREITDGKGVDLLVDYIGGEHWLDLFPTLSYLGTFVSAGKLAGPLKGNPIDAWNANPSASPALCLFSMHTLDDMPEAREAGTQALISLLAEQKIDPLIHARIPLADVAEAHEIVESRRVVGKVILKP